MRLWKRPGRQGLASGIAFLLGIGGVVCAAAVGAVQCYPGGAQPLPVSNNRVIAPDWAASHQPDLWGEPGAPEIGGHFACAGQFRCTLPEVLRESHACALLVVQKGRLVYEYYDASNQNCNEEGTQPNGRDKQYGLKSVTKSVVSTLLGHMVFQPEKFGPLPLDVPVSRYVSGLPEDAYIRQVTLAQALTMTSALAYDEVTNCLQTWTSDNPETPVGAGAVASGKTFLEAVSRYARRNPRQQPGKDFYYAGLNTALVGLAVESLLAKTAAAEPRHLDQALEAWVWKTAGMRDAARWKADKADMPNPYCCLYATARDVGRFGDYLLHQFKSGDPTTPLRGWMEDATRTRVWPGKRSCKINGRDVAIGYGYQWWTLSGDEGFTALGFNGQFLHLLPDRDTVIVQFGSWPQGGGKNIPWPDRTECRVYAAHRFLADHDWR